VLRQGLGRVLPDEAPLLGVSPGALVWVREVALVADGVPWVWARSVARPADLRTAWRDLAGLGNRSLGAALFADPRVGRGNLLARALGQRDPRGRSAAICFGLVLPAHASATRFGHRTLVAALWARRSVFYRVSGRVLVTEVFSPEIPLRFAVELN